MHRSGPPRKFFRPSWGNSGPRLPNPGAQQDFTVDRDTPSGAFYQSSHPYYPPPPPPPMEGPPHMFGHGPPSQFIPYPPPYYGHYPRPPGFGYSPQPRGRGYGNQGWDGWRGRGRGRYGGGGYRARGGRYSQSKWQNEGASSNDIDAYYSKTMFEDPWKELLPESPQSESGAAPSTTREGGSISSNIEQEIDASTLGETAKKDSVEDHPDDQGENVDCTDRLLSVGDISGTCSKATNDQQSCNDSGVKSSSPICTKDDDHDFVKTASDDSDKTETVECNLNPVEGEAQNQVQ